MEGCFIYCASLFVVVFSAILIFNKNHFRRRRRFRWCSMAESESVSSSVFDKLTDELLIEILIRLPLKPANLCKCVSKPFRSLISGSYFVSCYVKYHQGDESFGFYRQSKPNTRGSRMGIDIASGPPIFEPPGCCSSFTVFSKQLKPKDLQYLASNNGLVLCCAVRRRRITYFVCNPLTKQWVALPPPPSNVETVYVGFICKPQYLCDEKGEMGSKTSFKVVRLEAVNSTSPREHSRRLKFEIFCSVSWRWTEEYFLSRDHELFRFSGCFSYRAVVCHGLLHWDGLSNCGFITYNPYNGECRTIKLPHVIRDLMFWDFKYSVGECCGRLRFTHFSFDDENYQVWELRDYGNGGEWLLLHKVHLDEVKYTVRTIDKIYHMRMLFPHPLNQDVVYFWCYSPARILEYNMRNKLLQAPSFYDGKILGSIFIPFVLPCWPTALPLIQQHGFNS